MDITQALQNLQSALEAGNTIKMFRSGAGLRIVRVENGYTLVGYGEHPQIQEALSHAAEDYLAGGREYSEVYGKLYPQYITGTRESSGPLDNFILRGGRVIVRWTAKGAILSMEIAGEKDKEYGSGSLESVLLFAFFNDKDKA